jgi:hypothetical protein
MIRLFNSEELADALEKLVKELVLREIETDIYVLGGAAFLLRKIARRSTVDIDAKVTAADAVLEVAEGLALKNGWPSDWFNNAARVFVPFDTDYSQWDLYLQAGNVRVHLAPFEDLLIMKLNAARQNRDDQDIAYLIRELGLNSIDEIAEVYETRCPGEVLPQKAIRLLSVLLNEVH